MSDNPYFVGEGHNDLHGAWAEGHAAGVIEGYTAGVVVGEKAERARVLALLDSDTTGAALLDPIKAEMQNAGFEASLLDAQYVARAALAAIRRLIEENTE